MAKWTTGSWWKIQDISLWIASLNSRRAVAYAKAVYDAVKQLESVNFKGFGIDEKAWKDSLHGTLLAYEDQIFAPTNPHNGSGMEEIWQCLLWLCKNVQDVINNRLST